MTSASAPKTLNIASHCLSLLQCVAVGVLNTLLVVSSIYVVHFVVSVVCLDALRDELLFRKELILGVLATGALAAAVSVPLAIAVNWILWRRLRASGRPAWLILMWQIVALSALPVGWSALAWADITFNVVGIVPTLQSVLVEKLAGSEDD